MQSLSLWFCHSCWNETNTDVNSHACLHALQLQRQSCQIKSNENTAFFYSILRLSRQNNDTVIIELTWWLNVVSRSCTDWVRMEPISHSIQACCALQVTPGVWRNAIIGSADPSSGGLVELQDELNLSWYQSLYLYRDWLIWEHDWYMKLLRYW